MDRHQHQHVQEAAAPPPPRSLMRINAAAVSATTSSSSAGRRPPSSSSSAQVLASTRSAAFASSAGPHHEARERIYPMTPVLTASFPSQQQGTLPYELLSCGYVCVCVAFSNASELVFFWLCVCERIQAWTRIGQVPTLQCIRTAAMVSAPVRPDCDLAKSVTRRSGSPQLPCYRNSTPRQRLRSLRPSINLDTHLELRSQQRRAE